VIASLRLRLRPTVQIEIHDLADVLCLAKGLTPDTLRRKTGTLLGSMAQRLFSKPSLPETVSPVNVESLREDTYSKALRVPAIVPPSRELGG
jgi:hypothetical protein